jgi:hypothetical protein
MKMNYGELITAIISLIKEAIKLYNEHGQSLSGAQLTALKFVAVKELRDGLDIKKKKLEEIQAAEREAVKNGSRE